MSLVLNQTDADAQAAMGFVLAGGRSSRMGMDKALVEFDGQPLVAHALRILSEAGLPAAIAGARSALDQFAPVVEDSESDRGPLAGICAALAATSARFSVFLPVDSPYLPSPLLNYLLHSSRDSGAVITLSSLQGFAQTFPAVVDRSVLPYLSEELQSGRAGCYSAFVTASARMGRAFAVLPLEEAFERGQVMHPERVPLNLWFSNLNTLEDLKQAQSRHPEGIA